MAVPQNTSSKVDSKTTIVGLLDPSVDLKEWFRTELTADGESKGWGFKRSSSSEWFSFYNKESGKWLKANNDHRLITLKNKKPGAWEKFKILKNKDVWAL